MEKQGRTFDEVHVLWITAGMSCDGDSVALTAAATTGQKR